MNYDPHEERKFGMAVGESIEYRDLKCDDGIVIPYAHDGGVLDIDFNPNKPNYIVSGGKDGIVLFWDLRKTDKPLRSESKHSHWYILYIYGIQLLMDEGYIVYNTIDFTINWSFHPPPIVQFNCTACRPFHPLPEQMCCIHPQGMSHDKN